MSQLANQRVRSCIKLNFTIRNRNVPCFQALSFSDDTRRKRSEVLRSLRNEKKSLNSQESIDYRYRGVSESAGLEEHLNRPIEDLWDNATAEAENERQRSHSRKDEEKVPARTMKKFLSFFDEVDSKMKIGIKSRKIGTSHKHTQRSEAAINSSVNRLFDALQGNSSSPVSASSTEKREHKSIFDAFPLKSKSVNPNTYDKQAFTQYHEAMKQILESDKFSRKHTKRPIRIEVLQPITNWLLRDEQAPPIEYGALKEAGRYGVSMKNFDSADSSQPKGKYRTKFRREVFVEDTQANVFYSQLMEQRDSFLKKSGLSKEQLELAGKVLDVLASQCARSGKSAPLSIAWEKSKEAGIIPSNDTLNVYLYVNTSGLLSSALSDSLSVTGKRKKLSAVMSILGNDRSEDDATTEVENDTIDFPTELALFHDLLYKPTEKSVSLRVKRLVTNKDAAAAEELLDSFPVSKKMRMNLNSQFSHVC